MVIMVMMIIEADQFHTRYRQGKMGKLTLEQRGRLTGLLDAGMTIRDVAHELGCDKNTVLLWKGRFRRGEGLKDLPRVGRPRVTSARQDASIINKAETNRSLTGM